MSTTTKYRTCNLCEALCGLAIEVEDDRIISIKGDKQDVFSKGHICPKAVALKDLHEDPDRLRRPVAKIDGEWQEISWSEAIDRTAQGLYRVQQSYGQSSLGVYQGNPSVHNLGTYLYSPHFVRALKTKNRYSATSVDQLAHHLAGDYMLGHPSLVPVPDIDRTDLWIILGGNPLVSNGSLMTAPNVGGKMKDIQARGGKVIVIDPRRTETAIKADQHLFIKPGSDIWLLLAWLKLALQREKLALHHLDALIDQTDIDEIRTFMDALSLERASLETGISTQDIIDLADLLLATDKAVVYGRLGVSAAKHGALNHWAINALNMVTGHFDRPGGAMMTSPLIDLASTKNKTKRFGRWHSRVRSLPEYGGELPSSTMAEDILTPGEGQLRGLVTSCGNPVLSVPNGAYLDDALASLDFMVSIDIYINETTRHADIILPPATGLETAHYGIAFHNLAVRNTAKFSHAVFDKSEGAMYDWEIFSALTAAYQKLANPEDSAVMLPDLKQMLHLTMASSDSDMTFEELKSMPHGIDLGPLKSTCPDRLATAEGRIDLFPDIYRERLKTLLAETHQEEDHLLLIGRRHLRSNNSWLHNSYRMVKGPERCTVLMHPVDAEQRNILDESSVVVTSRVGSVTLPVKISEEMMQGVISIPHGWGHDRRGVKMDIAQQHAGVSLNDLIDHNYVDNLSGVSVINGIPVQIDKVPLVHA